MGEHSLPGYNLVISVNRPVWTPMPGGVGVEEKKQTST